MRDSPAYSAPPYAIDYNNEIGGNFYERPLSQ